MIVRVRPTRVVLVSMRCQSRHGTQHSVGVSTLFNNQSAAALIQKMPDRCSCRSNYNKYSVSIGRPGRIYSIGARDRFGTSRILVGPQTGASEIMVVSQRGKSEDDSQGDVTTTLHSANRPWEIRQKILPKVSKPILNICR